MRILFFIAAISLIIPNAWSADQLFTVSAGEHGNFSRIVLNQSAENIKVEIVGDTIRLQNLELGKEVDLREINERQKAFRINSAALTDGAIELKMNCACSVQTKRLGNGKFIVDVLDDAKISSQQHAPTNLQPTAKLSQQKKPVSREDQLSVEQAHDRMMELLKQAANEGLITMGGEDAKPASISPAQIATADEHPESAPTDKTKSPEQQDVQPELKPASAAPAQLVNATQHQCQPDTFLTFDGARFEADPLSEIESLQADLANAAADAKSDAARTLANGLLSIGFGEEALALLKDNGESDSILSDIARAVAEQPVSKDGRLMGAKNCAGAHALWQSVANQSPEARIQFGRSADALDQLPSRLKKLIAVNLALKMVGNEAWDEAQKIFEIASAEMEQLSPDLVYVQTRLADHDASSDASRETLIEIAAQNTTVSDQAMLTLAESYAKQGGEPHDGFTEDIGALAKTIGSSQAVMSEALAWAAIGNLEAAMMLLESVAFKSADDQEARRAAIAMIETSLLRNDRLTNVSALDAFLTHQHWIALNGPQHSLNSKAADFALKAGLPGLALQLMKDGGEVSDKEHYRKMAAAALSAGNGGEAIRIAAPFSTDHAFGEIIAKANIKKKEYNSALAAATALTDIDTQASIKARAGWLARAWTAAADGFYRIDPNTLDKTSALHYGLAAYMNGDNTLPNAVDAVMSQSASVINEGLHSLFSINDAETALERGRSLTKTIETEMSAFEEILRDG